PPRACSDLEFSKCVRRHQVTKASGRPLHPFFVRYGVTASVRPFCMSTTVPYWSNMHTLIVCLSTSAAVMLVHRLPVPLRVDDHAPLDLALQHQVEGAVQLPEREAPADELVEPVLAAHVEIDHDT